MTDPLPARPQHTEADDVLDDVLDIEFVDEHETDQDDAMQASAVASDRERAAGELAEVLDAEMVAVPAFDDEDGSVQSLTTTGGMTPVAAAAASVTPETHASAASISSPAAEVDATSRGDGEETTIECPGCGLSVVGFDPRPTAAWFCPRCDYPLFLVRRAAAPEPDAATRAARRRLPGTSGRTLTAAGPCWSCGEWNEAGVVACLRCAATLPKPLPPQVPAEAVPPEIELVEVEVMYWPPVLIATIGGFGAGAVFLWAVLLAFDRL